MVVAVMLLSQWHLQHADLNVSSPRIMARLLLWRCSIQYTCFLGMLNKTMSSAGALIDITILIIIALQHLSALSQVLNSYGKVFPTQPPSGRPVREAPPGGSPWERHIDEQDVENPAESLESKKSIGRMLNKPPPQLQECARLCLQPCSNISAGNISKISGSTCLNAKQACTPLHSHTCWHCMTPYCPASVFDAVFVIGHMLASGQPAWCHSDSKKNLQLEQVQLEAPASSSAGAGPSVKPGTSDYERRKQERQQAIKSVPIPLPLRVSVWLSLTVWLCLALSWRGVAVVPER